MKWLSLLDLAMIPRKVLFLMLIGLLSGCIDPRFTRMPEPFPTDLRMEAFSYRFHDPFPDTTAGPNTYSRPPSFRVQRDPARQSMESRLLLGMKQRPGQATATPPRALSEYPEAIQAH